jgi:hypothetical protein
LNVLHTRSFHVACLSHLHTCYIFVHPIFLHLFTLAVEGSDNGGRIKFQYSNFVIMGFSPSWSIFFCVVFSSVSLFDWMLNSDAGCLHWGAPTLRHHPPSGLIHTTEVLWPTWSGFQESYEMKTPGLSPPANYTDRATAACTES